MTGNFDRLFGQARRVLLGSVAAALIPAQESIQIEDVLATLLQTVRTLGRRTAELHLAFAHRSFS